MRTNLNKLRSEVAEAYEIYPRPFNGEPGHQSAAYHYSIWQQEVSVFQRIPKKAIMGVVK